LFVSNFVNFLIFLIFTFIFIIDLNKFRASDDNRIAFDFLKKATYVFMKINRIIAIIKPD